MATPSLFAHRDFRLLLLGQTTSQIGAQVSGVAIPLLAVLTLQATPLELGLVTASSTLAFALIGLPAGAWLDRLRRRPVLVASDLARALLLATIPLAAVVGILSIAQLVVVSLLTGFARVFFDVGYQSYCPAVIGKDHVLAGRARRCPHHPDRPDLASRLPGHQTEGRTQGRPPRAPQARRQTSRVRGMDKVAADFSLLAAAVNLARLAVLGLTRTPAGWATATA